MPTRAERWGRRLIGAVIVAALLGLVALPTYLSVSPAWRPTAVRLACAVIVVAGCARARRWAREALAPLPVSPFDAPPPPPPVVEMDGRFLRLRDDLVSSTRSRRYFDVVLWPRLCDLAGVELPRPPEQRARLRRGPSLKALGALVALVERRP
jgi:hypothetical protein